MPGMIEHLYFDSLIYHSLSARPTTKLLKNGNIKLMTYKQVINRERFMLAGIMPDLADSKYKSHYKYLNQKLGMYIPDLYLADRAISRVRNDWSVRSGLYAHIYLDQKFMMNFVVPKFYWDAKHQKITSKATDKVFSADDFFSSEGLFKAYGEVATAILDRDLLKMKAIETLPDELPEVNILEMQPVWQWRDKFNYFVENRQEETNEIFSVSEAIDFIREQAVTLTAHLLYTE